MFTNLINIVQRFSTYWHDKGAAIAIMFAVMAPMLVGASGMALDYARAYLVQQRLAQAIDAAALAAAAASTDPATIEQKVQDFFDINYPEEKIGAKLDLQVEVIGDQVHVSGSARYDTTFMQLVGVDEIDVDAETTVQREVKALEVVLVLDNTGSMGSNNNIGKLRTATCEFIEILFGTYDPDALEEDCLERYDQYVEAENEYVKVGLVPYATSVNVGPYGLGYDDDGEVYEDGVSFLLNPAGLTFSNDADTDICILEQDDGTDVTDFEGPWPMYRWCRDRDDDGPLCDYWQNYYCTAWKSDDTCKSKTYKKNAYGSKKKPDYICPNAAVLPLTTDMTALKDRVNEMEARGNTYGSVGMAWGWRVLSPDYPFEEGVDWDNYNWRKVIVMMTDGNNVYSSPYSAYGYKDDHNVDSKTKIDNKFKQICQSMDTEDDVTVYTITFEAGVSSGTIQLYKDCAINGGFHEHADNSDELIEVFRSIARELSNLYIRN
jgi:Flp pilus assembly protein TadG